MGVFKACDIRGRYGDELTADLAFRVGRAVATLRAGERVLVAGDHRLSTPDLKRAAIDGLLASGADVVDAGTLPTPAFYFAKAFLHCDSAIMVTGSHNPASDNGLKVMLGDMAISPEQMGRLKDVALGDAFAEGQGALQEIEVVAEYVASLTARYAGQAAKRIVVDAGNGAYSRIAPETLRALGHDVVCLYCEPDGRFPNRSPNPTSAGALAALQDSVAESGADLGVGYDGDGDRAVFVDDRGRIVPGDCSIVLLARQALETQPGPVVYDQKASSIVPEEVVRLGGTPLMERSGHAFIKRTLQESGAVFAGEVSGHFFFGELGYDDALYATLAMVQMLNRAGMPSGELVNTVPHYPISPDIRVASSPESTSRILAELEDAFAGDPDCAIHKLDGIRIDWGDGWALVRPSVTEPLATMRFEARTRERLAELQRAVAAASPALRRVWTPQEKDATKSV